MRRSDHRVWSFRITALPFQTLFEMEQQLDIEELSYLMELMPCNMSDPSSSIYNFSRDTAVSMIIEYQDNMLTLNTPITIVLLCLYIPICLCALFGNLLVIYIVFHHQHMRQVKNLFLVNLAIADVLVSLFCIPLVIAQRVYRLWIYGSFMCKMSRYMQGVAVTCSILTLSGLSVDRYLAIKHPMSLKRLSGKCQALCVLLAIWLLSAIMAGPVFYIHRVDTTSFKCLNIEFSYCIEDWPHDMDRQIYGIMVLIIIYVLPLSIVAVSYGFIGRALCSDEFLCTPSDGSATIMLGRKRVARMLIALIIMFVLCWLPYNVCSLSLDINPSYRESLVFPFTLWLGLAHSAINPFLYWFLNKNFRHGMRKVFQRHASTDGQISSPFPQFESGMGDQLQNKCPSGSRPQKNRELQILPFLKARADMEIEPDQWWELINMKKLKLRFS